MPLKKSASKRATEENFHEFRHGKTYKKTRGKFGKEKARKQMIAAVLSNKRKAAAKGKKRTSGRKSTR
jgi:hypothetical protein